MWENVITSSAVKCTEGVIKSQHLHHVAWPNFIVGQLMIWLDEWFWEMFEPTPTWLSYGPEGGHIVISVSVCPSVCHILFLLTGSSVRFSSENTRPISPMMIPINWGNNVDVQRALHFDLDPFMTAGQGHQILRFCEFRCLTGSSLCSLLLQNYLTNFSNNDTNQLREQCRCATCTSFWPWPLNDCRSRSQNTSILWIIFPDG